MLLPTKPSSLLRHILLLPAGRALLLSAALWLLTLLICKHRFWRDPHSAFFSSEGAYDLHYSAHRQSQAQSYISSASNSSIPLLKARLGTTPEICAAFVTVKRENKQYIDEAVASVLEGLNEEERGSLSLQVLFADTETGKHPSWRKEWMRNAVDGMVGYNVSEKTMWDLREWEKRRNFYIKGVFDYLYALRLCYDTNAPYLIMFEDDIIVADGWMAKTREALKIIQSKPMVKTDVFWDWVYLRLFYTETAMSWEKEDFWYREMWLTMSLASLTCLVALQTLKHFSATTKKNLDRPTLMVLCIITIPAFTTLLFMCGKYSIFPPSTVFTLNKHGCCTQGLLFPRPQIPDLMRYLEERGSGQTDNMIEEYANGNGKQRLAMGKQVLQHVGLTSSRDNTFINSQSTWAFWFETYDVGALRDEKVETRRKLVIV